MEPRAAHTTIQINGYKSTTAVHIQHINKKEILQRSTTIPHRYKKYAGNLVCTISKHEHPGYLVPVAFVHIVMIEVHLTLHHPVVDRQVPHVHP